MTSESFARRRHLARNTLSVMVFFALAAGAALVRNVVIAQRFGVGADLDAYYASFRLPDLLFTVVAGGALATAFIPVFAELLAKGNALGAWRLAAAITNLVVLVVCGLVVVVGLLAPWLVQHLVAPGFDAAQQAETALLMRLVLISTLLFAISAVQGSVLHGFKHFLLPALAPVLYPLGIAAGALWLAPTWGVRGLAAGAVVGAFLHLVVKVPGLVHYGFRWWPVLELSNPVVRRVLVLVGPRVLDLGVFHLTMLATTNLASRLGAGSVSALEWGWHAMQLPETVIGTSLGLVAFPTMAELAARRDLDGLRRTLGETLRTVIALSAPASLALILLGRPLLELLYQRGAFDARATDAVYGALCCYALGLMGHASLELAARAFFARQDTVTPLLIASGSAALNIGLGVLLMTPLGHAGLALANSVAVSAEVLFLLLILRGRLRGVEGRQILRAFGKVLVATLLMGLAIGVGLAVSQHIGASALGTVLVAGTAGGLTYLGAAIQLRLAPLQHLPQAVTLLRH